MTKLSFEEAEAKLLEYITKVEEAAATLTAESLAEYDANFIPFVQEYWDAFSTMHDYAEKGIGKNAYEVFQAMRLLDRKTDAEKAIGAKRKELNK